MKQQTDDADGIEFFIDIAWNLFSLPVFCLFYLYYYIVVYMF